MVELRIRISDTTAAKLNLILDALHESGSELPDIESVAEHAIQQGTDELGRLFYDYIADHTK